MIPRASAAQGYYQEAGRAGRDGRPSDCVLLYARADIPRLIRLQRGKPTEFRRLDMKNLEEARIMLPPFSNSTMSTRW